ncbi:hypothetical protein [Noviherbaspirillum sp.]|uniref:hypothetical protein n=1 Tax=Noviherbaspirillum sp. TaxID=1926288 RepID=UPI002FE32FDA
MMKQWEIQGGDGVAWTCVQAMTGASADIARKAEKRLQDGNGQVSVVCTPSGGEKSVHVDLPLQWDEQLSDDDMLNAIAAVREAP